jgi:protein-S-isoprenylcysteine O-methyltransferase Ste14
MPKPPKPSIYDFYARTLPQRATFAVLILLCSYFAAWILLGPGLATIGAWFHSTRFGHIWPYYTSTPADALRRAILATALSIYFLRLLLTIFVFSRRGIRWSEVAIIVPWLFFLFCVFSILGALNPAPFAIVGWIGVALYLFGSWTNTWSEHQRNLWKQRPENRGHLYTGGLFRYTRHPNYLGDLILFSGLCLICGRSITAIIPTLMLAGFVFANIPTLDKHLQEHYGDEFTHYATHTRKLIPFMY